MGEREVVLVIEAEEDVATSSCSPETKKMKGSLECVGKDEEDGGAFLPQVGEFTRTNTDVTFVGGNEESCGSALNAPCVLDNSS